MPGFSSSGNRLETDTRVAPLPLGPKSQRASQPTDTGKSFPRNINVLVFLLAPTFALNRSSRGSKCRCRNTSQLGRTRPSCLPPLVRSVVAAALCVGMVMAPRAASAQDVRAVVPSALDGKRKLILASRQHMLSQHIAKSVCFQSLGVTARTLPIEFAFIHELFEQTQADLRNGSALQNTAPETDPSILTSLDSVAQTWSTFGPAAIKRDMERVTAEKMAVLAATEGLVAQLKAEQLTSGLVPPAIVAAIAIAARQSMLTQKASKEFCLIAAKRSATANRASLKATTALFNQSLQGLRNGSTELQLQPPPVGEIIDQVDQSERDWARLNAIFTRVSQGGEPTPDEIAVVSRTNVAVMQSVNMIVELYDFISD